MPYQPTGRPPGRPRVHPLPEPTPAPEAAPHPSVAATAPVPKRANRPRPSRGYYNAYLAQQDFQQASQPQYQYPPLGRPRKREPGQKRPILFQPYVPPVLDK